MKKFIRYFSTASFVWLLTSCGGIRKAHSGSTAKSSSKPHFEHELIGGTDSPWEATDRVKLVDDESVALRSFIDDWRGTPHRMGGNTKKGVDCSGFVIQAYQQVYEKGFMGRRAEDIFGETKPVKRNELEEGDLVFFKISGHRIDHVGIYLGNDEFVHVSSSHGVMVSNLNESYFDKRFFMGGRSN